MKRTIGLILSLGFCVFSLNSCDPWEDENNNGGSDEPTSNLLKEVKKMTGSIEGKELYTYDTQNKLIKSMVYTDITDQTSYVETSYQYPGEGKVNATEKTYQTGSLVMTKSVNFSILTSTTAQSVNYTDLTGEGNSEITYSTPCGISKIVTTFVVDGETQTTVQTFEYIDSNCSSKEFLDGELYQTTTNDNKFSPRVDPFAIVMGVTKKIPIKILLDDGTLETINYQYNENNYPISANHSFNPESGEENFSETFIYQ